MQNNIEYNTNERCGYTWYENLILLGVGMFLGSLFSFSPERRTSSVIAGIILFLIGGFAFVFIEAKKYVSGEKKYVPLGEGTKESDKEDFPVVLNENRKEIVEENVEKMILDDIIKILKTPVTLLIEQNDKLGIGYHFNEIKIGKYMLKDREEEGNFELKIPFFHIFSNESDEKIRKALIEFNAKETIEMKEVH